jgi:hypothetical protein
VQESAVTLYIRKKGYGWKNKNLKAAFKPLFLFSILHRKNSAINAKNRAPFQKITTVVIIADG